MTDEKSPIKEAKESVEVAAVPKEEPEQTKQYFRKKAWDALEANRVAIFPRPIYGRIPNFKGADKAAERILELDEFKNATSIEVNPDKSLEHTRILALEHQKELYVPVPKLKEHLLKKISISEEPTKYNIKQAISRWGIEHTGATVDVDCDLKIDLLVLGSVAVSKEGYRIGKGKGYADLEFAILKDMGAITDDTVIVTTVHDLQVFDTLPKEIFKPYDVPVDIILTPTQTIVVENKLKRPKGIIWNILSKRRLNLMPALQQLKEKHEEKGLDTTLKETDTDIEENTAPRRFGFKRYSKSRPRQNSEGQNKNRRGPRPYRSKRNNRSTSLRSQEKGSSKRNSGSENAENIPPSKETKPFRKFRRFPIDFSLMVSNIERSMRIRDLKVALTERGVRPADITWRGGKGFCYLHYAKPNKKKEEIAPLEVDNVIEILQNLKINGEDCKTGFDVKILEPKTPVTPEVTPNVTEV